MKTNLIACAFALLFCAGCGMSKKSLISSYHPKDSAEVVDGLVYHLPRTVLEIKVTYDVSRPLSSTTLNKHFPVPIQSKFRFDPNTDAIALYRIKSLSAKPIVVPDLGARYVIDTERLTSDQFLHSNIKLDVSSTGVLTSVDSDVTDKAPEVLSNTVSSAIKIAKIAAGVPTVKGLETADANDIDRLFELKDSIAKVRAALAAIGTSPLSGKAADENGQATLLLKILDALVKEQKRLTEDLFIERTATYHVTLRSLQKQTPYDLGELEGVQLVASISKHVAGKTKKVTPPKHNVKGIVTRSSAPVEVKVRLLDRTTGNRKTLQEDQFLVHMSDLGAVAVVPVIAKRFTQRHTTLTLDSSSGSPTSLGFVAGSGAEAISGAIDTQLGSIQSLLQDLESAELNELTNQVELIQKRIELIEEQQKLDALLNP